MNINRDYLIINDVKKSNIKLDNGSMFFYITDKNTQNIFVNLVINVSNNDLIQKYANIENAKDYTLTMNIVKPSNVYKVIEGKLHDKEKAIFEFNLREDCCDEIGTYRCELLTKCNIDNHEEITTSNKLTYKVKSSVLNDLDDIVEAPEYPLVIQLFDKLSDIEQYEEDRRANELARQLAEEQRQAKHDELVSDMTNSIQAMDNKVVDVENRISAKEQAVDKLITDTKADIDDYKTAKDQEINEYKALKDTEINEAIANQNTTINAQNGKISAVENNVVAQNDKLDTLETKATTHEARITAVEAKNTEQDGRLDIAENRLANIGNDITNTMQPIIDEHTARLDAIEAIDVTQNTRLDAIEVKNQQQDDRLLDIEKVNKKQDIDIKCLYGASQTIDVTEEGNSIYLQNSNNGFAVIDEIKGNTLVNCNKEPDKELILNGNINTSGDNAVTITEGVDGGKVDVSLEGNTLVNVSKTKDSTAITKAYTVENSGNHIALQGDIDGSCRPVITGNTLWIDNDTEEVLTAFDATKNLRLQSSFEDNLVTQEMIDSGEEVADNLGKYKVEYKVTGKNKFDKSKALDGYEIAGTGIIKYNGWFVTDFIPAIPNTSYGISGKDTGNSVIYYDKNKQVLKNGLGGTSLITVPTNAKYVRLNGMLTQKDTFQIEEGDTATSYEPYKEYTKTLYLNSPLLEGDTIEEKDGGIYHVHRSELVAYTEGDETSLITDKVNTLHQLETPQYELIKQSNLAIPSYANGHLNFDTAVPIEKVEFKPFSEELTYLYPNTQYTIQFISTRAILADYYLGGTLLLSQNIVQGLNRISITTPSELVDNKLTINGNDTGANIMEVIVTDIDRELIYFEGMKSVGEGKELQVISINSDKHLVNTQRLTHEPLRGTRDAKDRYVLIDGKWYIERKCGIRAYQEGDEDNYKTDLVNTVYPLEMPIYEEIDYNPLEVYSGTTNITTNSVIPTNITVKNHGFNCLLKPSTTYTISSNLGLNTVTTPSTLTEDCLRFMDTDTSDVTTMKDVLILEGDWTSKADLIPANFSGIESAFEQEYDAEKGKYKVNVKVANEDKTRENNITFYINEPLRGVGDVKDRVYVKDDKVVVERNCGSVILDGTGKISNSTSWGARSGKTIQFRLGYNQFENKKEDILCDNFISETSNLWVMDTEGIKSYTIDTVDIRINKTKLSTPDVKGFKQWLQQNPTTVVYQLAEPTYEEVEYNDTKLFIESFKNSSLSYNSNVPVTSKLYYSYSVPIVDTVAQTADISNQQDSMIIDLATQVAVMEMMLM